MVNQGLRILVVRFKVLNPKMVYTFGGDRLFLGEERRKKENAPYLGLELEITDGKDNIPKFSPGQLFKSLPPLFLYGMFNVRP